MSLSWLGSIPMRVYPPVPDAGSVKLKYRLSFHSLSAPDAWGNSEEAGSGLEAPVARLYPA